MSDLQLGVGLEGLDAVLQQIERINGAQQAVGASSQAANRQAAAGATQATSAMQSFATTSQTAAQRVQGVAGAIQQLVSVMGSSDRSAGMVASVAGATAQFAAMGSMLGPGGTVAGAVIGFTSSIASLAMQNDEVAASSVRAAGGLAAMGRAIREANAASTFETAISRGILPEGASATDVDDRIAGAEARLREIQLEGREAVVGRDAEAYRRSREEADALNTSLENMRRLRGELDAPPVADIPTGVEAPSASFVTGGSGGRGASGPSAEELAWLDDVAVAQARAAEEEALRTAETEKRLAVEEREYALAMEIAAAAAEADERRKAARESEREASAQRAAEMEAHHTQLLEVAADAETSFASGYVTSIDSVAAAWRRASDASKAAGKGMLSEGRLLERGLVAVGNNIAESIGGTMVGALGSAVGAWLDGSKSIGEAAEGMAKSIIRGLVQEGIVQAVTETARGIADLASYQYATAGLHFAAAAAWGAVAGVAGAVGAATGAFGGGAGASQGPSQRELASRDRDEGQRGGTNIYNIYPGQVLATKDELSRVVLGAANYNARMGRRLDRRLSA